jgi:hypothetical protein
MLDWRMDGLCVSHSRLEELGTQELLSRRLRSRIGISTCACRSLTVQVLTLAISFFLHCFVLSLLKPQSLMFQSEQPFLHSWL